MSDKRPNYEVFQSPIVELLYPWLNTPDVRYNKTGVYQTKLRIPFEDAQDFIALLERVRNDFIATLETLIQSTYTVKDVYEHEFTAPDRDASDEEKASFVPEPTGKVLFKAKLNAVVTPAKGDTFTQAPILKNAADNSDVTEAIWTGTLAKAKGQIVPWTNAAQKQAGVTLRLRAVQVHELVTGEGSKWGDFD